MMKKVGGPLQGLLTQLKLDRSIEGWRAVELWPSVVGTQVAARAQAVSFRDGVLLVQVANASWMNEMIYLRRRFQKEINKQLGEDVVTEIKIQLNRESA